MSAILAEHYRPVRTKFGIISPAEAAARMWAGSEMRLSEIADWLSRQIGRTVRPVEASAVITTILEAPDKRRCRWCGDPLGSERTNYCSDECYRLFGNYRQTAQYHVRQGNPAECSECGKPLRIGSHHRGVCSHRCARGRSNRRKRALYAVIGARALMEDATCEACWVTFRPRVREQVQCGRPECHDEHARRYQAAIIAARPHVETPKERACVGCGASFQPRRSTGRYCTEQCRYRSAKRRQAAGEVATPRTCQVCLAVIDRPRGTQTFCGDECRLVHDRERDRERYRLASQGVVKQKRIRQP